MVLERMHELKLGGHHLVPLLHQQGRGCGAVHTTTERCKNTSH